MREINLTQGKVAFVDDADFEVLNAWRWYALSTPAGVWYAARGIVLPDGRRYTLRMHREIMGLAPFDGKMVDHANGDGLDNRRANLRLCTFAENLRNRRSSGAVKFKGVTRYLNQYRAAIRLDGEAFNLGRFSTSTLAAHAYDTAARELHGDFARLNFD